MLGSMNREPQINITTLFNLYPGANKQQLHRDDNLWPIQRPRPHSLLCNCVIAISDFENGNIGNVYLYANEFINTMTQKPLEKKLLPIASIDNEDEEKDFNKRYCIFLIKIRWLTNKF